MAAERAIPVCGPIAEFLDEQAPDVVLVSPLIDAASEQVDWIKAARARGIRSAACIASWDNLTNKGLLRIEPDLVVVWNEAQKREAHEYHYIPDRQDRGDRRAVVRPLVHEGGRPATGRPSARASACPTTRPFLLFTGSSSFISESRAEVAFVRQLDRGAARERRSVAARHQRSRAAASVQLPRLGSGSACGPAWRGVLSARAATTRSTLRTAPTSSTRSITRPRSSASIPAR